MRIGIVGAGFMGSMHAAGWAETPAQMVGIAAETCSECEPLAGIYNLEIFPDLEALLPHVDVVDVCTPTHLHAAMIIQAAEAGKHVICEKPLCRTVEESRTAIHACRRAGVMLLVAHVVRFFPEYALAKAAVVDGQIGKPGVLRLSRGSFRPKKEVGNWFLDEAKSGGILMDLMIHDYDYARWIAGDVESVYAKRISAHNQAAGVDYGLVILRHKSGGLSHISGAWAYPPPTFRTHIELAGDGGLIEFDSDDTAPIRSLIARPKGEAPDVGLPSSPTQESPYTTQIKEFYLALAEGSQVRVTPEDGLAAVQIAEAAIHSAQSGLAIQLEPLEELGL